MYKAGDCFIKKLLFLLSHVFWRRRYKNRKAVITLYIFGDLRIFVSESIRRAAKPCKDHKRFVIPIIFRRNVRIKKYFRLALIFNFHPAARIIIIRLAAAKLGGDVLFSRLFVVITIAVFGIERRDRRKRTGYAYGIDGNAEQIRLVVF